MRNLKDQPFDFIFGGGGGVQRERSNDRKKLSCKVISREK